MRYEVTIGNCSFYISKFPVFQSLEVLGDLQQRFGAPLLEALGQRESGTPATPAANPLMAPDAPETGQSAGGGDALAALLRGLSKISGSLNGRDITALAKRLLDPECVSVSINGAEAVKLHPQTLALTGIGPEGVIELCMEVVRHNYSGFIERFKGRIGAALSLRTRSL